MDFDETMVDAELGDQAADTPDEVVEEEQDESESLDSLIGEEEGESAEEPEEDREDDDDAAPKATDAGWFRKRINKAVEKAVAETEARLNAQFEQTMAPIMAKMMEDQAQELVRSRKVSDIETARELVRLRAGQPAQAPAQTQAPAQQTAQQPRNANGQFAPREDPAVSARIAMLEHQKAKIDAAGGPDVANEFMKNKEIKQKVITGEMDFYDVADYLREKSSKKKPPSPMRSPNGASGNNNPNAIDSMSDEQFARMERKIKEGARYTLR